MKIMRTKNFSIFFEKKSIIMLLFGFSSGLPILLVFSTLSVWLIKAGIERSTVTLFSWVGFAYAFKYIWAPIIDGYKISIFKNFGHRKSWLLISQIMIVFALICVANSNPLKNITFTAIAIIFVAFASATQDITIDAFRIESAPQKYQGILSSMYIAGYRIAMIVSGAGSLLLASYLGTEIYSLKVWQTVYLYMACFMSIGILTTIFSTEPKIKKFYLNSLKNKLNFFVVFIISLVAFAYLYSILDNPFSSKEVFNKFLFSSFRIFLCFILCSIIFYIFIFFNFISKNHTSAIYINPITNFINRYGKIAIGILLLIGLYRIADVVMGVMANIFYLEKGFNIKEIATYSKFFGVFATIIGGFAGGIFAMKFGTMKALFLGALLAATSNLLFMWLAIAPISIELLITAITADNISSGFAGAAFVIYLSALTSLKFTATQYALFSSLMLFLPKLIAGYAGSWVDSIGYPNFFLITAILGIPVLFMIIWISKVAPIKERK
jgi:MFS transporter, PAT family, beta-lactamase induction signal transducer AmpG